MSSEAGEAAVETLCMCKGGGGEVLDTGRSFERGRMSRIGEAMITRGDSAEPINKFVSCMEGSVEGRGVGVSARDEGAVLMYGP